MPSEVYAREGATHHDRPHQTFARARAVAATINREGAPHPAFARASQYVTAAVALLDTFLAPSTDEAEKVYQQLKDIHGVVAMQ
jgi:hypothetical protein